MAPKTPPKADPAEIRLSGKILCTLTDPPARGTEIILKVRLRVTEDGTIVHEDDTEVHFRRTKLLGAWRDGDPEPPADPQLWDQAPPEGTFTPEGGEGDGKGDADK